MVDKILIMNQIYRELAQQKKEKEDAANANLPKVRNYENEQLLSVADIRKKEEEAEEKYAYNISLK